MRSYFAGNPALIEETAFRNGSLQGAYFILAARAMGLDCGPMSGFDAAKVNAEFFPDGKWKANFLCNLGYGDHSKLFRVIRVWISMRHVECCKPAMTGSGENECPRPSARNDFPPAIHQIPASFAVTIKIPSTSAASRRRATICSPHSKSPIAHLRPKLMPVSLVKRILMCPPSHRGLWWMIPTCSPPTAKDCEHAAIVRRAANDPPLPAAGGPRENLAQLSARSYRCSMMLVGIHAHANFSALNSSGSS